MASFYPNYNVWSLLSDYDVTEVSLMTIKLDGNQKRSSISGAIYDIDDREEQYFVRVYYFKRELNTREEARQTRQTLLHREKIIDFLNEVEEQDWELDADDIKHILNNDFDYIRKQYQLTIRGSGN
jgi:tmRNA-binding protein